MEMEVRGEGNGREGGVEVKRRAVGKEVRGYR